MVTSTLLKIVITRSKQQILIPFYHAVTNTVPNFIGDLYAPRTIEDFEKDLDVLLEFYEPISLIDLISVLNSGKKPSKNYFHLTFDDGLANFYDVIAPILIKRNIPATVFLNTNFVDNKELFFRYKASLLLSNYKKSNDYLKDKYHQFIVKNIGKNISVSDFLLGVNFKNKENLDDLASELNINFNDFLASEKPYLTKNQIHKLIEQGFTFGAHSANHPLYSLLDLDTQIMQTNESINWVTNQFNLNYKAFSFPFNDVGISTNFYKLMKEENLLDISFGTSGIKRDNIENNLQRISFEEAGKSAKLFLLKAYVKYFFKTLTGRSIMKRN